MSENTITVEATFENGVLRPAQPLPLVQHQKVRITLQLEGDVREWPADVAAIYRELEDEDRRLAEAMFPTVRETWPVEGEQP